MGIHGQHPLVQLRQGRPDLPAAQRRLQRGAAQGRRMVAGGNRLGRPRKPPWPSRRRPSASFTRNTASEPSNTSPATPASSRACCPCRTSSASEPTPECPGVTGYDTSAKPRTSGALNKRLKAGLPGDVTSGLYDGADEWRGERSSRVDPQQRHKRILEGRIDLGEPVGHRRPARGQRPTLGTDRRLPSRTSASPRRKGPSPRPNSNSSSTGSSPRRTRSRSATPCISRSSSAG